MKNNRQKKKKKQNQKKHAETVISTDYKKRAARASAILAIIIGILFRLSICFAYDEDWNTFITQPLSTVLTVVLCSGGVFLLTYFFFTKNANREACESMEAPKYYALKCAAIIFACWVPYIIIRWPGVCLSDTVDQISQVLFPDNVYTSQSLNLIDDDVKLNQHHPVFTTFIYAFFYRFGINLGNPNIGLGILTTFQCMAISFGMGKMLEYMKAKGINRKFIIGSILFFAICPVNPTCATLLMKDGIFIIFFIFAQLNLIKLFENEKTITDNNILIRLGIWTLLCMLTRHNAIYVGILMAGLFIVIYKKKALKASGILATAACVVILLNNIILPAFSVTKTDPLSAYSVPFITIARAMIEHGDEFTDEEKEPIIALIGDDGYTYSPILADGIVMSYDKNATSEERRDFLKDWVKIGLKYPGSYIKGLLWFWSPMYAAHNEIDAEWIPTELIVKGNYRFPNGEMSGIGIANSEYFIEKADWFIDIQTNFFAMTWPVNIFYGCDLYFWGIIILLVYLKLKKQLKNNICIFSMCIFTILTIMAGPVSYIRYIYPIAAVMPFLLAKSVFLAASPGAKRELPTTER